MTHILSAQNVVKKYANHTALNDVSLSVPEKSIFGLLGPNGAGKTSLIRIITQITAPDSGVVLYNNEPLKPEHISKIGYLPEERGLYKKMKVGEQLLYLAQLKGMKKSEAMEKLKVWFRKFEMQDWWAKNIEDLSKGMQQKVQFVATVLHEPKLIILDEPFSGFDPINANLIKDEIFELRDKGCTIIFSTHRMESVEELCDHIALIHKSEKVLDGSTKDIKKRYKSHTYLAEGIGKLDPSKLPRDFELIEYNELPENECKMKIKIPTNSSPNDLTQILIQQFELQSFKESIPSMNDIFIMTVTGNQSFEKSAVTTGFTE